MSTLPHSSSHRTPSLLGSPPLLLLQPTLAHACTRATAPASSPPLQKAIHHLLFCCVLVPIMSFLSSGGRAGGSRGKDSTAPKAPGATPAAAAPSNNSLCAADQLRDMAFDGELIADPVVASDMSSRTSAMRLSFG